MSDSEPRVLTGERREAPVFGPDAELAWGLAGWIGWGFVAVGGFDLLLTWVPLHVGSVEWEFATVTQTMNGVPVPALGLALVLASAAALGRGRMVKVAAGLFGLWALFQIVSAVLYLLTLPVAMRSVQNEVAMLGLKKAIAKTIVQLAGYTTVFVILALRAWRESAPRER